MELQSSASFLRGLGLSSLRSGMVCKQRDQPLNPAISVHYWGGYAVRTHQIGLENRVHGAGAREERAQRGAEEDQVLLGRHSRHGCPFTQWSHCRLEVRDWRKVVLSNHNSAKPGAHPSCSFCTLPQRLQSYINHPSAMLRTAVRRFSSAASKQMPTPHPKKHHKKKNHFATAGLPLVLFVVGGYVALTQFVGGKYEARDHRIKSQSEHTFNLEEEHKRMTKKLTLDDFEIKPVPKPKDV